MSDLTERAREYVRLLDAGDVDAILAGSSARIRGYIERGWSIADHLRDVWRPGVEGFAGGDRRITSEALISPISVRFTVEGDRGRAFLTVFFDDDGVGGFSVDRDVFDGIVNVVINTPDDRIDEIRAFYTALLGAEPATPRLVFDEGFDYHAPDWRDPDRPQQLHADIHVHDPEAAEAAVLANGATPLHVADDHRTYADPIGHPFCLYPGEATELWRVVIDCPDARQLSSFYETLIPTYEHVEDGEDFVALARRDGRLPMLGFQRVANYVPPQWPDPAHPAQMHFDINFDDALMAQRVAAEHGAHLQPTGGSCPVYTDPAGHPFCLCMYGM